MFRRNGFARGAARRLTCWRHLLYCRLNQALPRLAPHRGWKLSDFNADPSTRIQCRRPLRIVRVPRHRSKQWGRRFQTSHYYHWVGWLARRGCGGMGNEAVLPVWVYGHSTVRRHQTSYLTVSYLPPMRHGTRSLSCARTHHEARGQVVAKSSSPRSSICLSQ